MSDKSKIKVLVACEFTGIVREAFRKQGFNAYSCDIIPAEDNSPYHIQCDVREILNDDWDLMIAHPPCTYLANAGIVWLYRDKTRWDKLKEAVEFFKTLLNAPIRFIAVENPVPHRHAVKLISRKYDFIVRPYEFGDTYKKPVCFWVKNLPPLLTTRLAKGELKSLHNEIWSKKHKLKYDVGRERSRFFHGLAEAMAKQWGNFVIKNYEKFKIKGGAT